MKVYITKYALTTGIIEKEAEPVGNDGMIKVFRGNSVSFTGYDYFHKGEWFESKEQAIEKANVLKEKKIKSIKQQLSKMENLSF